MEYAFLLGNNRMKIIQIMSQFTFGGAEIMCENLMYALKDKGVQVIAVSLYDLPTPITERLEKNGIDVRYLQKKKGLDFSMIKKLVRVFKEEKPDAVHSHVSASKYAMIASRKARIGCRVHTIHSIAKKDDGWISRKINKLFFKLFKVTPVGLSPKIQESIIKEYKLKKEKVPVVYNGVDLAKCLPKEDYSIKNKMKILHIGRFAEVKNHKGLINAFGLFHEKYEKSELQLIGDGELRSEIQQLVEEKGLSDCVQFLGLQDNVYQYLNEADIFTLSSFYEGIPMTLIEAMGTGLPIVATNVGGIPDMLKNGENAILVETNIEKIVDGFSFFAESEENRRVFGEKAKIDSKRFSSEVMAEEYLKIYKRMG